MTKGKPILEFIVGTMTSEEYQSSALARLLAGNMAPAVEAKWLDWAIKSETNGRPEFAGVEELSDEELNGLVQSLTATLKERTTRLGRVQ